MDDRGVLEPQLAATRGRGRRTCARRSRPASRARRAARRRARGPGSRRRRRDRRSGAAPQLVEVEAGERVGDVHVDGLVGIAHGRRRSGSSPERHRIASESAGAARSPYARPSGQRSAVERPCAGVSRETRRRLFHVTRRDATSGRRRGGVGLVALAVASRRRRGRAGTRARSALARPSSRPARPGARSGARPRRPRRPGAAAPPRGARGSPRRRRRRASRSVATPPAETMR